MWTKYYLSTLIGAIGEPLIFLWALGYGMGRYIVHIDGMSYLEFMAPGLWITACMNASSLECTFNTFTRLSTQKTYDAIIATPISPAEIAAGDVLFGATRSFITGNLVLAIYFLFGLIHHWSALFIPFIGFVVGLFFGSLGLCMTALARSYDFFTYYFILVLTPALMLTGVFFPVSNLPQPLRDIVSWVPLTQMVSITRDIFLNRWQWSSVGYIIYTLAFSLLLFLVAAKLMHRRLIK
ncbi:MAG: ABC transporter permease [Deltaproteobacteria bacterium]|nr:ABC transporter permease [Deltaproteobacteria bacterium]